MGVMTFAAAQLLRVLPRNAISRAMGALCEAQVPAPLMNGIVRAYTRAYDVDLEEACPSNLPYTSFDAFFTRKLREGARALDGDARIVTFGNGMVAREEILSIDDRRHRVAWAILDAPFKHYSAAAWVEPEAGGSHFVWTADLLPNELAGQVEEMMTAGIEIIRKTMESTASN